MSVLDSYMKDLAELVNKDRGTANIAGVTEAAKIMKVIIIHPFNYISCPKAIFDI